MKLNPIFWVKAGIAITAIGALLAWKAFGASSFAVQYNQRIAFTYDNVYEMAIFGNPKNQQANTVVALGYTNRYDGYGGIFVSTNTVTATNTTTRIYSGVPGYSWERIFYFYSASTVSDLAYNATSWNGVTGIAPSQNAVRDKIESLVLGGGTVDDTAYNSVSWDGDTSVAPSKNAVRDEIELLLALIPTANSTVGRVPYLSAANVFSDSPIRRNSSTNIYVPNIEIGTYENWFSGPRPYLSGTVVMGSGFGTTDTYRNAIDISGYTKSLNAAPTVLYILNINQDGPGGSTAPNQSYSWGAYIENDLNSAELSMTGIWELGTVGVAGDANPGGPAGNATGMYAVSRGSQTTNGIALRAWSRSLRNGSTNISIHAAIEPNVNNAQMGVFVEAFTPGNLDGAVEDGMIVVDNRSSGYPLFIGRTANGTHIFELGADGDLDMIKGVAYSWPSSQGGASTVLQNDGSGNLSWGAGGGGGLSDGDKGDITVSGTGATWTIDANVVSDAKFRQSAGLSVVGRSANTTGNVADITAANDNEVLRRSGTSIGFGALNLASSSAVTGLLPSANIDSAITRDTEWDTIGEIETATGVNILVNTEIDTSAELRSILSDETGTGPLVFQDGNVGAATATTPSAADNDTSVATTAFVQTELGAYRPFANSTFTNITTKGVGTREDQTDYKVTDITSGTSITINWTNTDNFLPLAHNGTVTWANTPSSTTYGREMRVIVTNTGSFTLTWPASGIAWREGAAPTLPSSKLSVFNFVWNRTNIDGYMDTSPITEDNFSFTDVTTANSTTSKHGLLKKLSGVSTEFLDGVGNWSTPPTISDGDKGDITVSSSGTVFTVDNDAITYAKIQNISAASRLLGRGAASGSGDVEEISLGSGLSMSGTTLSATSGGLDTDMYATSTNATTNAVWNYTLPADRTAVVRLSTVGTGPTNYLGGFQMEATYRRGSSGAPSLLDQSRGYKRSSTNADVYFDVSGNDMVLVGNGTTNEGWNWHTKGIVNIATNGGAISSGFAANPVTFDNTPGSPHDYLSRASDLSGSADSKVGLFSIWFKRTVTATEEYFFGAGSTGDGFHVYFNNSDELVVEGYNSSGTQIMRIKTDTTVTDTSWHHFAASWNLANTGQRHIYLDGVSHFTSVTYTDDTIEYTQGTWAVCSRGDSFGTFTGCVAMPFFANEYFDLSVAGNLDNLYNAGAPVDPGANGSSVTGTQPLVYLNNTLSTFHQNLGSGGDFTVNGTITTCGTLP